MAEGIPSLHGADISGATAERPTNAPTGTTFYDTDKGALEVTDGRLYHPAAAFIAQTIAMGDAAVVLTKVAGAPTGTLLTGNWLLVDAESAGTEDLTLPPEADCVNDLLLIKNTGGESVILKSDAPATLATIATGEVCFAQCDGTTWTVMQFIETT